MVAYVLQSFAGILRRIGQPGKARAMETESKQILAAHKRMNNLDLVVDLQSLLPIKTIEGGNRK